MVTISDYYQVYLLARVNVYLITCLLIDLITCLCYPPNNLFVYPFDFLPVYPCTYLLLACLHNKADANHAIIYLPSHGWKETSMFAPPWGNIKGTVLWNIGVLRKKAEREEVGWIKHICYFRTRPERPGCARPKWQSPYKYILDKLFTCLLVHLLTWICAYQITCWKFTCLNISLLAILLLPCLPVYRCDSFLFPFFLFFFKCVKPSKAVANHALIHLLAPDSGWPFSWVKGDTLVGASLRKHQSCSLGKHQGHEKKSRGGGGGVE